MLSYIVSDHCEILRVIRHNRQNRHRKAYNTGALGLCGGLDTLKIDKISTDL